MVILYTLDVNFDSLETLNSAVNEAKTIFEELKNDYKINRYYIMRYSNEKYTFLGIKILFDKFEQANNVLPKIKEKIKKINGYSDVRQEKSEGDLTDKLPFICSLSMEFRNKLWDLLNRKPTDEELIIFIHYLVNPLLLSNSDELRIFENRIRQLKGET